MSFRCRQKFVPATSYCISVLEESVNNAGAFVKEFVLQNKELPDPAMFDLKNLLDSGVNLEEVNSKVLRPSTVNADNVVRKYTKNFTSNNEE